MSTQDDPRDLEAVLRFAIRNVTGRGSDDEQLALLAQERMVVRRSIEHNEPAVYCPGPGWPKYLVRSLEEFDRLQALSHRGAQRARSH